MNLPNEVTILILSFMPKSVVKQARLVCQLWADLGAQFLFDTIYISPRRIDMDVFEEITRHGTLRNLPQHLVYDSAVFEQFDEIGYAWNINWQYREGIFDLLGDAHDSIYEMSRNNPIDDIDPTATELDTQLKNHPIFAKGFREYSKSANEFRNIFNHDWFRTVHRGLQKLGPIISVTMRNTWEMIYDERDTWAAPEHDESSNNSWDEARALKLEKDMRDSLISRHCIRSDRKRLVGSPSARAASATTLHPCGPQDWSDTDKTEVIRTGKSSGYHEFVEVVKLLSSVSIHPKELNIEGGIWIDNYRSGIAAYFFDPRQNPEPLKTLDLASDLTSLQLALADNDLASDGQHPNYQILQQFLWKARSLEVLSLDFPNDHTSLDINNHPTLLTSTHFFRKSSSGFP
ncbi:MAG: hypothetical protein Q9226_004598 [Calogaya cf. arnoldii]